MRDVRSTIYDLVWVSLIVYVFISLSGCASVRSVDWGKCESKCRWNDGIYRVDVLGNCECENGAHFYSDDYTLNQKTQIKRFKNCDRDGFKLIEDSSRPSEKSCIRQKKTYVWKE